MLRKFYGAVFIYFILNSRVYKIIYYVRYHLYKIKYKYAGFFNKYMRINIFLFFVLYNINILIFVNKIFGPSNK